MVVPNEPQRGMGAQRWPWQVHASVWFVGLIVAYAFLVEEDLPLLEEHIENLYTVDNGADDKSADEQRANENSGDVHKNTIQLAQNVIVAGAWRIPGQGELSRAFKVRVEDGLRWALLLHANTLMITGGRNDSVMAREHLRALPTHCVFGSDEEIRTVNNTCHAGAQLFQDGLPDALHNSARLALLRKELLRFETVGEYLDSRMLGDESATTRRSFLPPLSILAENCSTTTEENARFAREFLEERLIAKHSHGKLLPMLDTFSPSDRYAHLSPASGGEENTVKEAISSSSALHKVILEAQLPGSQVQQLRANLLVDAMELDQHKRREQEVTVVLSSSYHVRRCRMYFSKALGGTPLRFDGRIRNTDDLDDAHVGRDSTDNNNLLLNKLMANVRLGHKIFAIGATEGEFEFVTPSTTGRSWIAWTDSRTLTLPTAPTATKPRKIAALLSRVFPHFVEDFIWTVFFTYDRWRSHCLCTVTSVNLWSFTRELGAFAVNVYRDHLSVTEVTKEATTFIARQVW